MRKDRILAEQLRNRGLSYSRIYRELKIPKSTLSYWFKNDKDSIDLKNILIHRAQKKAKLKLRQMAFAHKMKWDKIHAGYRDQAKKSFPNMVEEPLFTSGLCLYWGEGNKRLKNGVLKIANSDFRVLKIFIDFLGKSCGVPKDKVRAWLLLYPDLDETTCKIYWCKRLSIRLEQFRKTQYITGREKKRRLAFGVCTIEYGSREIKEKVIEWINLLFEYFGKKRVRV